MINSAERYHVKLNVQTSKYLLYNKAVSIKTTVLRIPDEGTSILQAAYYKFIYIYSTYTVTNINCRSMQWLQTLHDYKHRVRLITFTYRRR